MVMSYVQLESLVTTKVSYYETAAITLRLKENNYTHTGWKIEMNRLNELKDVNEKSLRTILRS